MRSGAKVCSGRDHAITESSFGVFSCDLCGRRFVTEVEFEDLESEVVDLRERHEAEVEERDEQAKDRDATLVAKVRNHTKAGSRWKVPTDLDATIEYLLEERNQ